MEEDKYRKWDLGLKCFAMLGATFAFLWGVIEYRQSDEREYKKEYWLKQLEVCEKVSETVARVSRIKKSVDRAKHIDELSELYFGQAALVLENESLRQFREFIDLVSTCSNKEDINECHYMNMRGYQLNVAKSCRNQLAKSWKVELESLNSEITKPVIW